MPRVLPRQPGRHRALRATLAIGAALALAVSAWPAHPGPAAATNHYTLETVARYQIAPDEGRITVRVAMDFTNTTPDPAGQFSVFNEISVAVHDEAIEPRASDAEGPLDVSIGPEEADGQDVNVATVELREGVRYNDSVAVNLTYELPDGEGPQLRVRPSLVVFPAWSFGTGGQVRVTIPDGYEMRVDGDPLEEDGTELVSGPIDDPTAWLALVTAVSPAELATYEATVPLEGGTADLVVRAFGDDEAWGERTLDLASRALPLIEAELGLPYPVRGQLVITEAVSGDAAGFGEAASGGAEIAISFDQPPFTVLHQLGHVWLPSDLVQARWIVEGLASHAAAAVAGELDVEPPYDPAAEAEAHAEAAFPLDAWPASVDPEARAYGYAAAWAMMDEVQAAAGPDALRAVLARVAGSVAPYELTELDLDPPSENGSDPVVPLTSRSFLDQLEAVSDADLAPLFAERVLSEADAALLEQRAEARTAFDALVADADGWGAPDPVGAAMGDWRFDEAAEGIEAAAGWLADRDELLDAMAGAGLSAPDRLQQAYRAYGGGSEARDELEAERAVVDAYAEAAERVNGERTLIERLGLVGGQDPAAQLGLANGRFTDGDLNGATDAVAEASRIVDAAEGAGIVRLVSLVLVVLILAGLAIVLFRRRAYTRRT